MQRLQITPSEAAALVDRLAEVKTIGGAPRAELEWLVAHGDVRHHDAGEVLVSTSQVAEELIVLLKGRIVVYFDHGTGRRHSMESRDGSVTGLFPYSRLVRPQGDVIAVEPSELIAIHKKNFPALVSECPEITTALVHAMLDRARRFAATAWQDEKMVSLGRLAAGIAHELNNPASAAARGAQLLDGVLNELGDAARALGAIELTAEQSQLVEELIQTGPGGGVLSPLERADREEAVVGWLTSHGADVRCSQPLAEQGVTTEALNALERELPSGALDVALRWYAAARTAKSLVSDVDRATTRIYDLVSAVKRFTFMDRAGAPLPTDIRVGLADTVAVLASKATQKSITVRLELSPELPTVMASVAELNQVWSNLIDNALDAVESQGEVVVCAGKEGDAAVVRVIDNGPGIPTDVFGRIFDPFFTTKKVGEGVGLGLDVARRIVHSHNGQIDVETEPGRTEFRVRLPVV